MQFVRAVTLALCALSVVCASARADEAALLAREHYRRGTKLFDLQHYAEAAAEYEAAYEAKEVPDLLYNIGQAYRYAGEKQKAINAYKSFLRHVPEGEHRDEVLRYIEVLKQQIAAEDKARAAAATANAQKPPPPPATVTPTPAENRAPAKTVATPVVTRPTRLADPRERARGVRLRAAGIGVGAVGVVGVVLGGVFAGLTANANDKLNHPPQTTPPPPYDTSLEKRAKTYQALAPAMFAVGGAALVAGVTLAIVGQRKVTRNYALAPVVAPGYVAAALTVTF